MWYPCVHDMVVPVGDLRSHYRGLHHVMHTECVLHVQIGQAGYTLGTVLVVEPTSTESEYSVYLQSHMLWCCSMDAVPQYIIP